MIPKIPFPKQSTHLAQQFFVQFFNEWFFFRSLFVKKPVLETLSNLGGGFKYFFIFTPIWGNDPF